MRHAALTACGVLLVSLAIAWSGALVVPESTFRADPVDAGDALAEAPLGTEETAEQPVAEKHAAAREAEPAPTNPPASPVDGERKRQEQSNASEPEPETNELERLPARSPLSQLASPQPPSPPRTKMPDEWKSTRLFKPVASSAGTLEAQGYRIALAGIEPLRADETCTFEGMEWPCGLQARTAFRAWLRGRAIACVVPPQPDQQLIVAECHLGKTDLSEWLVANGWVKASPVGPYGEVGRKASEARKGIHGRAPAEGGINLPRVADPAPMNFPELGPAVQEPEPELQIDQPPLSGPFPPAPQLAQ